MCSQAAVRSGGGTLTSKYLNKLNHTVSFTEGQNRADLQKAGYVKSSFSIFRGLWILTFMLPGINPITKLLLFHHKKLFWFFFQWSLWVVLFYNPSYHMKKRKDNKLFNSWLLKYEQDDWRHTSPLSQSSPPYCTASQFAVDILQYQTENLGQKKRFIAFQLFFYMKLNKCIYLYLGVQDSFCMRDVFLLQQFGIHFLKSQNFSLVPTVIKIRISIWQMALPNATLF